MLLRKPYTTVLGFTVSPLLLIEAAGRTCYKSEAKITDDSAPKFAEMVLRRGHESVIEHASATVRFVCDRGVSHEIVRHRLASYSQESTRYCDYSGELEFVLPEWVTVPEGSYPDDIAQLVACTCGTVSDKAVQTWLIALAHAATCYKNLREDGKRPEEARSVLPNSLKTEVVMTANFREWRHFFKLRTAPAAHPQMREVAIPLLKAFQKIVPVVFDDITPPTVPSA